MLRKSLAAAVIITAGIMAGCGSGGGTTASTSTVSGVAATGAPMSGTVYLKDSANNPEMSTQINPQTGGFMFNVNGKTPPFMLRAGTLYSMGGTGTANINPLSNLMVANMAGFSNMSTMNSFYKNPNGTTMRTMFGNMSTARMDMRQKMGPLLNTYGVANADPISAPYVIGQGLDRMFDDVKMSIDQNGNVTMMNSSGMPIFTGPMGNMMGGTMMSGNIMQPGAGQNTSSISITPVNASLQVNGTQQFSANIPVTWSVGLNSGIITSGGLYTAPSYQGMFLVKATSIADPTKSVTATVLVGGMGMMM
ncbi:hypothetical protein [Geobacter argillaceus]|uniref:Uncharacterized protein n=1 Tax=Geobacter argillaceus TaxID=345631 RepID=A0A562VPA1_9BACT|nr:hypothetical protein [Geobacter argillaceus]TWJ19763.1 hypothetical protein JN12_01564 [Geobacter argillaceus]